MSEKCKHENIRINEDKSAICVDCKTVKDIIDFKSISSIVYTEWLTKERLKSLYPQQQKE